MQTIPPNVRRYVLSDEQRKSDYEFMRTIIRLLVSARETGVKM